MKKLKMITILMLKNILKKLKHLVSYDSISSVFVKQVTNRCRSSFVK